MVYQEYSMPTSDFIILVFLVILLTRALLGGPGVAPAEFHAQRTLLATHRSRPQRETREEFGLQSDLGTFGVS